MKKRINPSTKAHLIRGAFYLLFLLAVCVIPFARGQRITEKQSTIESTPQLPTTSSESGDQAIGPVQVPQFPAGNEPGLLYFQYDNAATQPPLGIGSQQFEPAYGALSDQVADDFVLYNGPTGYVITEVHVKGEYSAGGGPASSFNLYFYTNGAGNLPGTQIVALLNRPYGGTPPSDFVIYLNYGLTLSPGTYWVSVQAVQDFNPNGQWFWHNKTDQANAGAVWQNPGDGYGTGCLSWNRKNACMPDQVWPDQVFSIYGGVFFNTPTATPTGTLTPTATPTATPTGCFVTSTACGGIVVGIPPTDFTVNLSGPADPATVQGSDFMVNGTPANGAILINGNTTIIFHFNASPVVQGQNTMHIPACAFNCGNGCVQEFTCTFTYQPFTPTPTPTPTPCEGRCSPTPRPRPTPAPRP